MANTLIRTAIWVVALAVVIAYIGIGDVLSVWALFDAWWILAALALFGVMLAVTAFNLQLFFSGIRAIPYRKMLDYSAISFALGFFTPGKIGEFSLGYFLKKERIHFGQTTALLILDKLITVIVLVAFALGGYGWFVKANFWEFAAISIGAVAFVLALLFTGAGRGLIRKMLGKWSGAFKGFGKQLTHYARHHPRLILANFLLTIIKWLVQIAQLYALFLGFQYAPNIWALLSLTAVAILATNLPVSIGGTGVREGILAVLFSIAQIPLGVTINVLLVNMILTYAVAFALLAYRFPNWKKLKFKI